MLSAPQKASVVICSFNRREEILRAIGSCLAQVNIDLEILVYDDCSEDDTVKAICSEYPSVKVFSSIIKQSPTVLRNRGFREAENEFVISLDDDSYFSSPTIASQILQQFYIRPDVAVIGIPFIEPYASSKHPALTLKQGQSIASFTACAAILRRSAVLSVGGYRECFGYYGEEGDLAIRLRNVGWELIYGASDIVVHTKSPKRARRSQTTLSIRNQLYMIWFNFPYQYAFPRTISYFMGMLIYRFSLRDVPFRLWCFFKGLISVIQKWSLRSPVSTDCYSRYRSLPSHGKSVWEGDSVPRPCHE